MPPSSIKKTKIVLADYSYQKDIEYRLLLSDLTLFELQILQEIVHNSLVIHIGELADILEVSIETLLFSLVKLEPTKLFKIQQMTLHVDKEVRKYLEFQIEKFDEDFKPDLEFLQALLTQVPIHVLPAWYAVPRTSDHIFSSIIENFLATPKIYRHHLAEIQLEHPILGEMIKDIHQAPQFKVTSQALMEKYDLTRRQLEEYLLHLEFNFAACLSYNRAGDHWQEVVTPLAEWRDYLEFEHKTKPTPIDGVIEQSNKCTFVFSSSDLEKLRTIRNTSMIEKSLRRLTPNQWVDFEQFFTGFTAPIGDKEPVTLKAKGKNWKYMLPTFSNHEKEFVFSTLNERFVELGIVEFGTHGGKPCFRLTSFGYQFIH